MLYYLHYYNDLYSPLRVFKYISFRAIAAAGTAFLVCVIIAPWMIRQLRKFNIGQYERKDEAPPLFALHGKKEGTPTMGGLLIILSVFISVFLWSEPGNWFVLLSMATMCYMGLVGFWDDYKKVARKQSKGLNARQKMSLQIIWVLVVVFALVSLPETKGYIMTLSLPFLKVPLIAHMGIGLFMLFIYLVLVGCSNAVNLTDGLDGLAVGCSSSVVITYMMISYFAGHAKFASYLNIPYVPGCGELAVFCGAMCGAFLGFLWYNCHPAQVFMGDTGSLAIGGAIAIVAILIKQEILLILVGGVFVMEAASVILQVASFKLRGKRIFAMAPIHHHFEMKKWSETQVTIRFWILSIIFALLGMLTLKIR